MFRKTRTRGLHPASCILYPASCILHLAYPCACFLGQEPGIPLVSRPSLPGIGTRYGRQVSGTWHLGLDTRYRSRIDAEGRIPSTEGRTSSLCLTALLPDCLPALLPSCLIALLPYCPIAFLPYCLPASLPHRSIPLLPSTRTRHLPAPRRGMSGRKPRGRWKTGPSVCRSPSRVEGTRPDSRRGHPETAVRPDGGSHGRWRRAAPVGGIRRCATARRRWPGPDPPGSRRPSRPESTSWAVMPGQTPWRR